MNGKVNRTLISRCPRTLREPGGEKKETIETGTLVAAKGVLQQLLQCQTHVQYHQLRTNGVGKIVLKKKRMLTYYHT